MIVMRSASASAKSTRARNRDIARPRGWPSCPTGRKRRARPGRPRRRGPPRAARAPKRRGGQELLGRGKAHRAVRAREGERAECLFERAAQPVVDADRTQRAGLDLGLSPARDVEERPPGRAQERGAVGPSRELAPVVRGAQDRLGPRARRSRRWRRSRVPSHPGCERRGRPEPRGRPPRPGRARGAFCERGARAGAGGGSAWGRPDDGSGRRAAASSVERAQLS
jgi:hypothetical protein